MAIRHARSETTQMDPEYPGDNPAVIVVLEADSLAELEGAAAVEMARRYAPRGWTYRPGGLWTDRPHVPYGSNRPTRCLLFEP